MPFLIFLRDNARWLAGGFLLTFFSSFGQTYFISLSAGHIREDFELSHGGFGALYMAATLASALTLPRLGQIVDRYTAQKVAFFIIPMLALASAAMAFSRHIVLLAVVLYLLRLFGQGMMTHNAFTAMGRWFSAQRGRAVSVVTLGHDVGAALFPLIYVEIVAAVGWRNAWLLAAVALLVVALPAIGALVAVERAPRASDPPSRRSEVRNWTRAEAMRDPLFYLVLLGILAPPFIGTTVFFHQVYLVELRGWDMEVFASSFTPMAFLTVIVALTSGQLIDRFSAIVLLPGFLLPLGVASLVLGAFEGQWSAFTFMALLGVSNGFSSTLLGALWPEIYGIRHLGSIRALTVAFTVCASAVGPGLTGFLIDQGVDYSLQVAAMGLYCLAASALMFIVARQLKARAALPIPALYTRPAA